MSSAPESNRPPPPVRVTSGAGFDFEDRVGAWLLVKMLVGEPMPAIDGQGRVLQAQTSALGWKIDDLLVSSRQDDGSERKLALSCKGNVQVSGSGLPADFVAAAWKQWQHDKVPLRGTSNALALVTTARHAEFEAIWREVKNACTETGTLGLSRIFVNPNQARVFNSVRAKSPTEQAQAEETAELIRHLHVLPIELHAADRQRENEAIGQCRGLLASRDLAEAKDVWDTLQGIAKKTRLEVGTVTLLQVWERLRARFGLLHHPDYAADWSILTTHATDERDRVETVLPNGHALERAAIAAELAEALGAQVITVVAGESGSGKSGLVKRYLAQHLPEATPLWLGNETATMLLSPVQRTAAGIKHTLRELLSWTTGRENVLVLDAAERLDDVAMLALAKALQGLAIGDATDAPPPWRVVVTTQSQALSRFAMAFAGCPTRLVEVGALLPSEVKAAVRDSSGLAWLTAHEATIGALTSLKALAWVLRAGAPLGSSPTGFASHIDVVEWLWRFWTRDDVPTAVLLIKLGEREAGSERSFAISSLDPSQQQAFQAAREWLPLRLDSATNHLRFEHDLAADWSRFQRLKELSSDPQAWAPLASHPLWTNALRLLGQHLLRRGADGSTAWDEAFQVDSAHSGLVQGLLFDAICLDPQAEHFLTQRAGWLLENRGRRLDQLLIRFHHIATVPPQAISASGGWIELYAEAHRRVIVTGRWFPVLRFVLAQKSKLAGLLSSPLARLTHSWLTQTPAMLGDNRATPFRQELADLAVAVVRTIQVHHGSGDILSDLEPEFYAAALAGMADRPAQVAELALELSGRRAIEGQTAAQIQAIVRDRQTQHERRLAADPVRRANHEAARNMGSMGGLGRQKLPPWPIGAKYGVDRDFRKACFKSGILEPAMRVAPAIAAEVLLALIVEDKPEREFDAGRHPYRERLGLDYPIDATIPIFWKSPFWPFLQIAPDQAVDALQQLVQFCTERWADGTRGSRGTRLAIPLSGTERIFVGDAGVLAWSQSTSAHAGSLHGALDSLERWLVTRIDAGLDVSATVSRLLSGSNSLAIVGVLINVGKYHPALFEGPLSALLSKAELYAWDEVRVEHVDYNFSSNFVSAGEQLFELAKGWVLAPHRRRDLTNVVIELVRSNPALADEVRGWTAQWSNPGDAKESLEQRITAVRLDSANYQTNEDGVVVCVVPAELAEEMRAWADTHAPSSQQLTTPYECQQLLDADQAIDDEMAAVLWAVLEMPPHEEPWVQARCERSIAGTITVLAPDWLARNAEAQRKVESIFEAAMASLPSSAEALNPARFHTTHNGMDFVAIALVRQWVREASPEAGRRVIQLLTSGDRLAANRLVTAAYLQRQRLGDRWWRLLHVGVLWAGLSMLAPRYGDAAAVELVWSNWWGRLRRVSLSAPCRPGSLDFARVDEGCARLMRRRQIRAYEADGSRQNPEHLVGASLDTQTLDGLFHWLLRGSGSGSPEMDLAFVSRFWELEVAHARDRAKEDDGELQMSGQFAYHLVEKMADLALADLPNGGRPAWLQVLELGPAAHNAVHHLVSSLFLNLSKGADPQRFEILWKALAKYALAANWRMPGLWFYGDQMRRSILGFRSLWVLDKLPAGAALRMQATFGDWAKNHLTSENDLAAFSLFLASPFAAPLRFDGLVWIDAALKAPKASFGFHRDACGDALIELILTLMQSDLAALRQRAEAHAALLSIAAALAATGRPDALAMQDRLRAALLG